MEPLTLRAVLKAFHPNIEMEKFLVDTEEMSVEGFCEWAFGVGLDTPLIPQEKVDE